MTRRRLRLLFVYLLAALPLIGWGASRAIQTNANSPIDWVTHDFAPRAEYDRFREVFGAGDVVIASWPGCTVDSLELDTLVEVLERSPAFFDNSGAWYFESVVTGRQVLADLTSGPFGLSRAEAIERLRGPLIGPDGEATCAIVTFTADGLAQREVLVKYLRGALSKYCGVPAGEWHLAGPIIDGLSVDLAGRSALDQFALPSALTVLFVCVLCLWRVVPALVVFGLSVFCQGATLALVHYCGDTMSALLIVMPPLIQVLAVAAGIHLTNYCFDAEHAGFARGADAAVEAVRLGWLPTILSAATTAIGLASLLVSQMQPIRQFGGYAAAGVLMTSGLVLTFIPASYALLASRSQVLSQKNSAAARSHDRTGWDRLAGVLQRTHLAVAILTLCGMGLLAAGLPKLQTSVRIETLFSPQSRILSDYRWLETHIGPLVPIEVVLCFDPDCRLSFLERVQLTARVERELRTIPDLGATMSAVTAVPDQFELPQFAAQQMAGSSSVIDILRTRIDQRLSSGASPAVLLEQALRQRRSGSRFMASRPAQHWPDGPAEDDLWRITAYASALDNVDYGALLDYVEQHVTPLLNDNQGETLAGVSAEYAGIMPLVQSIQQQLFADLFRSFLGALILITVVMTLVQAGVLPGLVSMVSNVFPIVLLFGLLGWSGVAMDIGTVMTASVALGIAVDDTLHFLSFFRRGLDADRSRVDAVRFAYQHCGRAMIQTSLICGLGLLPFAASSFAPTARFAWMMAALLGSALMGDLIVLPSLLLSPLGCCFVRHETINEK
ncbi:MMPL family transporter [bacterium]|nr:MMPL family transporter [bacterium]